MPPSKGSKRKANRRQANLPPYWDLVQDGAELQLSLNAGRLPAPEVDYHADDSFVESGHQALTLWFLQYAPRSTRAVTSLGVSASRGDLSRLLEGTSAIEERLRRLPGAAPRSEPDVSKLTSEDVRKVPGSVFLASTDDSRAMMDVYVVEVFSSERLQAAKSGEYAPEVHGTVRVFMPPVILGQLLTDLREALS
ncbi:MAG: hypothetical protein ACQEXJ_21430 [Myxococcota bacterium]